jgi:hypothetical protein
MNTAVTIDSISIIEIFSHGFPYAKLTQRRFIELTDESSTACYSQTSRTNILYVASKYEMSEIKLVVNLSCRRPRRSDAMKSVERIRLNPV